MADLQELFARLNGQSSAAQGAPASAGNQANYRHPSVSSPVFSPSPNGPQPHHASAIMSPATNTPTPDQGGASQQTSQQQSAQLLNLLRFNSSPNVTQQSVLPHQRRLHSGQASDASAVRGSPVSAADLAASFMSKTSSTAQAASPTPMPARAEHPSVSSENPQDLLLRLLNQPKPAQTESARGASTVASVASTQVPETAVDDVAQDMSDLKLEEVSSDPRASSSTNSPMRVFGSDAAVESSTFEVESAVKPKFTYVNPFDKLEAASPRNRTPVSRSSKSPTPKVEILKPKHALDVSSTVGSDGIDQHTRKSRRLSPAPSALSHGTVTEATSDLERGTRQEAAEALAEAEIKPNAHVVKTTESQTPEIANEAEESTGAASEVKEEEPQVENTAQTLEDTARESVTETLKEAGTETTRTDVADSWESAEAEDGTATDKQAVIVYMFPMMPFASITVNNMPEGRATFPPELFMDIARLKKEFDQIDRSLVAASKNFIVYALVKKSGFRIIRQESGQYRQVFENHQERIFNIALCTSGTELDGSPESILGIGVNGSVFWTSLEPTREDQFSDNLDTQGIVLPPTPTQDDNTSGGQLKTRAKPSSRNPNFFAVGRGKSIHIVWPKVAAMYVRGTKGICQTEKYFKERSLKISTGKAGKDFTFSEDDTVIVSLDKAGRMRFWDIRPLIDPALGIPLTPPRQVEVSQTLLEFQTTSPTAKSWPTSVFFFDKDKPFSKGIALRYVMVGMKQNHSFQLWDLGLGQAVQEINLPHEKESDAICSVSFHPRTGIMAVAHPTRNSIFFIHVSCPRYNLAIMNQATYLGRLAAKDDKSQAPLPAVKTTAIMTSISEYSFAPKGQIRSLYMLNEPAGPPDVDDPDNSALFELYVMHSKGVCTLRIRRSDLGLKKEGEPFNGKKAEDEGIMTLSQLKPAQEKPAQEESSTGGETPVPKSVSERSARESIKKESSNVSRQSMTPEAAMRASTLAKVESKQDAARAAIINGGEKSEKKKKKRATAEATSQTSSASRAPPPSYAQAAQATQPSKSPPLPESSSTETSSSKFSEVEAPEWAKKLLTQQAQNAPPAVASSAVELDAKTIADLVHSEVSKGFRKELDALYARLDEDRRAAITVSKAHQSTILSAVSSTLTENVEVVIRKMVHENMREVLLPEMLQETSSAVEKSVSTQVKSAFGTHLAREIPESLLKALQNPQTLQPLSETVAKIVTSSVEPIVVASAASVVNPVTSVLSDLIEQKIGEQLREAQLQRQADAFKISQLTEAVQDMTQKMEAMAVNQFELMRIHQQHISQSSQARSPKSTQSPAKSTQKTPEQSEAEAITRLMSDGNYEQGTMKWLQSPRTTELFNTVFVKCNPAYLSQVSPLLNLSTGAVVTDALDQNLMERLIWLDAVLKNVDPNDPETRDIVPKIMDVMNQRLTAAYIKLNEDSPGNPLLRHISALVTKVNDLARAVKDGGRLS